MSAKSLADAYERLKELRREGEGAPAFQSRIGHQLRAMYADVIRQGVLADRFAELTKKLDTLSDKDIRPSGIPADLIRTIEITALANRVFGDEGKADAWLQRPNRALSGQRPADLVKDELGPAVVRELLEQIGHGIFA